jgi:hypothetical protein
LNYYYEGKILIGSINIRENGDESILNFNYESIPPLM